MSMRVRWRERGSGTVRFRDYVMSPAAYEGYREMIAKQVAGEVEWVDLSEGLICWEAWPAEHARALEVACTGDVLELGDVARWLRS